MALYLGSNDKRKIVFDGVAYRFRFPDDYYNGAVAVTSNTEIEEPVVETEDETEN